MTEKKDWKNTVNQFLGKDFWNDFQDFFTSDWPAYNLYETETEFICQLALPGLNDLDDVKLSIDHTKLLIKGNAHYHLSGTSIVSEELYKGPFERHIQFPSPVQTEPIEAVYRKGIMLIRLEKLKGQEISEIIIEEED